METEVYLAKGDVTDEIVGGSGVVCLLGDQRRNTSRRGTIFKAGIRLLLIRRIVFFFPNSSFPPPITSTAVLLTRDLSPWNKTTSLQKKLLIVLFAFVIIFTYTVVMVL